MTGQIVVLTVTFLIGILLDIFFVLQYLHADRRRVYCNILFTCAFSIYTQLLKNILSTYYSQFFTWNRISNLDATFGSCLFTIKIAVASAVLFRNIRAVVVIRGDRRKNIQLISADVAKFILNYDVIITFLNFSVLFIWALGLEQKKLI